MARTFFGAPGKYDIIVDVVQGVLPGDRLQNVVHRLLKSDRSSA